MIVGWLMEPTAGGYANESTVENGLLKL